jgi:hypothetical protein
MCVNTGTQGPSLDTHVVELGPLGRADLQPDVGLRLPRVHLALVRRLLHRHGLLPGRGPPAQAAALALLLDAAVRQVLQELEGPLALLVRVLEAPLGRARQLVVEEPDVEGGVLQALLSIFLN